MFFLDTSMFYWMLGGFIVFVVGLFAIAVINITR